MPEDPGRHPAQRRQLKLCTLCAPPHHRDGVIHPTREDAEADTENFDGKTTE